MADGATSVYDPPSAGGPTQITELDVTIVYERRVLVLGGAAKTASFQAAPWAGWLVGWAMRESSGSAAATIRVHDGESTDGQLVLPVALASGASQSVWYGDRGLDIVAGLYVEMVSGQADVVLYMRPGRHQQS